MRLLERAGLVKVVRTRKVRGVTERYYAMAARSIVLPDPGEGGTDVLMRHAVADLEASPADGERHVRMAHLRLTEEQFAQLGARLQALADEYQELSDPSLPDASLVFALFHPAPREQGEGTAKWPQASGRCRPGSDGCGLHRRCPRSVTGCRMPHCRCSR